MLLLLCSTLALEQAHFEAQYCILYKAYIIHICCVAELKYVVFVKTVCFCMDWRETQREISVSTGHKCVSK